MDQSKLLLPCLIQTAKAYAGAWRLKTHLTGNMMVMIPVEGLEALTAVMFSSDLPGFLHVSSNVVKNIDLLSSACLCVCGFVCIYLFSFFFWTAFEATSKTPGKCEQYQQNNI